MGNILCGHNYATYTSINSSDICNNKTFQQIISLSSNMTALHMYILEQLKHAFIMIFDHSSILSKYCKYILIFCYIFFTIL